MCIMANWRPVVDTELFDTSGSGKFGDSLRSYGLTRREWEILPLLTQRLTDSEIAELLCISPRTASTHVGRILAKLGVPNRRQAAVVARSLGQVYRVGQGGGPNGR
jgi:DNA-binding NarL/FixJ family response regulator